MVPGVKFTIRRPLSYPSHAETGFHVPDKFFSGTQIVVLYRQRVITQIHKRAPLLMACGISFHPGSYRFQTSVIDGLRKVFLLSESKVHFGSGQLHIVGPVIFFVEVRRTAADAYISIERGNRVIFFTYPHGYFYIVFQIPDLVDTQPGELGVSNN